MNYSFNHIIDRLIRIGLDESNVRHSPITNSLLIYLALFMSCGGVLWGAILVFFGLYTQSLIPFGYVVISAINLMYFHYSKRYLLAAQIQITASILLPFMLQFSLGGFNSSGMIMIWSLLALIGSVVLIRGSMSYHFLFIFILLVIFSLYIDDRIVLYTPELFTSNFSLLFLGINIISVISIFFMLTKIKIDKDYALLEEVVALNEYKNQNLIIEQEMRAQIEISESRYRNLVEKSKVFICTHDLNGILLSVNKPGATILGYEPEELVGRNIREFIPETYANDFELYLEHIEKRGISESFMSVISKSNEEVVLLFRNSLVNEIGQDPYILGSAQDVTEWRKAESRERKIRSELELIISSVDDFVVEFDVNRKFKSLICRDEKLLFKPVSFFLGKSIEEVFEHAPEFARNVQKLYDQVIATQLSGLIEIKDIFSQEPTYYLARLSPIIEKDGSCKRCTGLVSNITERKKTEIQLRNAYQLQLNLLENFEGGILVESNENKVTLTNQEFIKLFDIKSVPIELNTTTRVELDNIISKQFVNPDQFISDNKLITKKLEREINQEIKLKDGRVLERDYVPLFSGEKNFGHLWYYRDITERKTFEQELKLSKDRAENANNLKTIFLGNLSHEIRTPLQGIRGFSELLDNDNLSVEKRKEFLSLIYKRTLDLQHIIDSLLDLASIETGEMSAFPVEFDLSNSLNLIFESSYDDFTHSDKKKSIELIFKNELPANSMVKIDEQHLKQVLNNLLNNALKFTNTGSVYLLAKQKGDKYLIEIADTGVGIKRDQLEYIFEPFRQAHEGLIRSVGGIGLGLSICQKLVDLWDGEIKIKSDFGKGSTVTFDIPRK